MWGEKLPKKAMICSPLYNENCNQCNGIRFRTFFKIWENWGNSLHQSSPRRESGPVVSIIMYVTVTDTLVVRPYNESKGVFHIVIKLVLLIYAFLKRKLCIFHLEEMIEDSSFILVSRQPVRNTWLASGYPCSIAVLPCTSFLWSFVSP